MSSTSLDAIKRKYKFKEISVATWRDPALSVHPFRGGPDPSESSPDSPYILKYKVKYSLPEPTDDEESEDERDRDDFDDEAPVDTTLEEPTEDFDGEDEGNEDVAGPSDPVTDNIETDDVEALDESIESKTLHLEADTAFETATMAEDDKHVTVEDAGPPEPAIGDPANDADSSGGDAKEQTPPEANDVAAATGAEEDTQPEAGVTTPREGSGDEKKVSFAPGTPDPKPRKKKAVKGAKAGKKKRVAITLDSFSTDVMSMVDKFEGFSPPPPAPDPPERDQKASEDAPSEEAQVEDAPEVDAPAENPWAEDAVAESPPEGNAPEGDLLVDEAEKQIPSVQEQSAKDESPPEPAEESSKDPEIKADDTLSDGEDRNDSPLQDDAWDDFTLQDDVAEEEALLAPNDDEPHADEANSESTKKEEQIEDDLPSDPKPEDTCDDLPAIEPPAEEVAEAATSAPANEDPVDLPAAPDAPEEVIPATPPSKSATEVSTKSKKSSKGSKDKSKKSSKSSKSSKEPSLAPTGLGIEVPPAAPELDDVAGEISPPPPPAAEKEPLLENPIFDEKHDDIDPLTAAKDEDPTPAEEAAAENVDDGDQPAASGEPNSDAAPIDIADDDNGIDLDANAPDEKDHAAESKNLAKPAEEDVQAAEQVSEDSRDIDPEASSMTDDHIEANEESTIDDAASPADSGIEFEGAEKDATVIHAGEGEQAAGGTEGGDEDLVEEEHDALAGKVEETAEASDGGEDVHEEAAAEEAAEVEGYADEGAAEEAAEVEGHADEGAAVEVEKDEVVEVDEGAKQAIAEDEAAAAESESVREEEAVEAEAVEEEAVETVAAETALPEAAEVREVEHQVESPLVEENAEVAKEAPPSPVLSKGSSGKSRKHKADGWSRKHKDKPLKEVLEDGKTLQRKHDSKDPGREKVRARDLERKSRTAEEEEEHRRRKAARKEAELARATEEKRKQAEDDERRRVRRAARRAKEEEEARLAREEAKASAKKDAEAREARRRAPREREVERGWLSRDTKTVGLPPKTGPTFTLPSLPKIGKALSLTSGESRTGKTVRSRDGGYRPAKESSRGSSSRDEVKVERVVEAPKETKPKSPPSSRIEEERSEPRRHHRHHRSDGDRPSRSTRDGERSHREGEHRTRRPSATEKINERPKFLGLSF